MTSGPDFQRHRWVIISGIPYSATIAIYKYMVEFHNSIVLGIYLVYRISLKRPEWLGRSDMIKDS